MRPTLLLAILALLAQLQGQQQDTKGSIEGRVVRVNSSEGIPDVQITLVGPPSYTPSAALTTEMRAQIDAAVRALPSGADPAQAVNTAIRKESELLGVPAQPQQQQPTGALTDSNGRFSFKNLGPGRYQIRAQRDGYFALPTSSVQSVGVSTTANTTATIATGQPAPEIKIELLKGSVISGRVRDSLGQPASNTQIGVYQVAYQNGRAVLQQFNSKSTDDRGEYRLFWIPPGDYYIGATPRRPNNIPGPQDTLARTFHPGVTDPRTATPIIVSEGMEASGMDIAIRADATGSISGRVVSPLVNPNGQPTIVSTFYLASADPGTLSDSGVQNYQNVAANRNEGRFEIRGILPGTYDLYATTNDNTGKTATGRTRVNVGGGPVEDVVVSMQLGFEIKVRLTVDGAAPAFTMQAPQRGDIVNLTTGLVVTNTQALAPVPTPSIRLQLRSRETYTGPYENQANQTMTFDPAGIFTFPNVLEGKYTIQANLPANAYISEIRASGNALDDGFEVTSQMATIDVGIKTNGARIQGVVRNAEQKTIATALVALVPLESRRHNLTLYKTSTSDASGTFNMSGIAPGEYKLFAWESVPNGAWMNGEFLARNETFGKSVTAQAGQPSNGVEVRVIPKAAR